MKNFSEDEIDETETTIDMLKNERQQYFTIEDVRSRAPILQDLSNKEIDRLLHFLWRRGTEIYADSITTDGTHSWTFGLKNFPDMSRKPIGRR